MAVDGTSIKNDIDNNLANKGYRGVRVANVITALKNVIDWVSTAVNGNLTTWLRDSDNQPGGANGDGVYRTGKVTFRGGAIARTGTLNTNPLSQAPYNEQYGVQVLAMNGGPAFMEFHLPGLCIHQLGVDVDGTLKMHPWGVNQSFPVVLDGFTTGFHLAPAVANRKLVFSDVPNNDHQFYGFGLNASAIRYQVDSPTSSHVFYAGSSPATSKELMRIKGNGTVAIGSSSPGATNGLEVGAGYIAAAANVGGVNPSIGNGFSFGWNRSGGEAEANLIFGTQGFPNTYLSFQTWDGAVLAEKMRLTAAGWLGIGIAPSSMLHVKGVNGHQQLRLETPYTPTNTGDPNGAVGQIAWDQNYFYVKVSGGWRRAGLNSW